MSQKNNKLPTAGYAAIEKEKGKIIQLSTHFEGPETIASKYDNIDFEKVVRRKDVEQLIRDSIGDYDERINDAKNIPRAWNMALEKLLEEVQNESNK